MLRRIWRARSAGVGGEELVFATVAAESEFGEAEEGDLLLFGLGDDGEDALLIAVPVEWGLVERGGGDVEISHG